jgi:mRNA interferase MazF
VSHPKRAEIYFVNLNPTQRREQSGKRPVLVISIDAINHLPLVVTVVVGSKGENMPRDYPTNVRVTSEESGLPLETVLLGFQLRSLDASRFPENVAGELSDEMMEKVEKACKVLFRISVARVSAIIHL